MTFWQEWFRYREMFFGLVNREVRARYRGSVLGFLWTLLNPLLQMIVYTLIFSVFMRAGIPNYGVFLFCALLPWTWFAGSLNNATSSINSNSGLIKKIYFPSELLPLIAVTSNFINFLFSLPVLAIFLFIAHAPLTPALLALPVIIIIQFLFTSAVALLLSMLNTFYRDVEQLLSVLLMVWFYLTPIIYPASYVPPKYAAFLALNPMFALVDSYRKILLNGQFPSAKSLLFAFGASVLLMAVVYPVFNRQKFKFAEVV